MRSVANSVYAGLSDCEHDVICLTETWLDSSICSSELIPKEYHVFRADRDFDATGRVRGGGVLLAVHEKIKVSCFELSRPKFATLIDVVACKISCQTHCLHIVVIYVPPDLTAIDFEYFVECLENYVLHFDKCLLIGDFNVPCFLGSIHDLKSQLVHNMASFFNLTQHNTIRNCDDRCLDLVFSNFSHCDVTRNVNPIVREDKYHPSLDINLQVKQCGFVNFRGRCVGNAFNFNKANFPMLYDELLGTDWSPLYSINDVNHMCDVFNNILNSVFVKYVPVIKSTKLRFPKWYSGELKRHIKLKEHLFSKYKTSTSNADIYKEYCDVRRIVKRLIARDFRFYMDRIQNSLNKDPRYFWSYVKDKKGHSSVPGEVKYKDVSFDKPNDIVNVFARHFSSTFSEPTLNQGGCTSNYFEQCLNSNNINVTIVESDVSKAIKKLKESRSSGVDQVPAYIIKDCCNVFCEPLTVLFNLI